MPRHWESDLIIGRAGASAVAPLVERITRFVTVFGLAEGKQSDALADVLIEHIRDMPRLVRGSVTWDQGSETARHAALTGATERRSTSLTRTHPGSARPTKTPIA